MRQAADTVKKLSLELGGNAPFIVFDDADAAVLDAIAAKFRNTGQTCVCANRLYVQDAVYEEFTRKLAQAASELKVSEGFCEGACQGPLINAMALDKVQAHVADAAEKGGEILAGGKPSELGGTFYPPTVIGNANANANANAKMMVTHEETFGPVAACYQFSSEEEVLSMANESDYGLSAYFYSRDIGRVWRVAEELEAGIIGINEGAISTEVAPFGGIKESGIGREGSHYGIDDYVEIKYMLMGK
ncbi:aldehyde dehydrogenase family protein [Chromohalobacter israelensis]|nr:aldehyde dehydrogenase family protein [Chromohalobacter salexigens]